MFKKIITTTFLLTACSASFAAELGGFYVRGDVGASKQENKIKGSSVFNSGSRFKNSPVYAVGAGYKFDDNFRADLNLQHRDLHYKQSQAGIVTAQKTKNNSLFLNGYYDFKNESMFTPYVTAGVGLSRNVAKDAVANDSGTLTIYKGKTTNNFAWNGGFGSKMNLNKSFDLDLGYKYVNLGEIKMGLGDAGELPGKSAKFRAHEVTLGLIYSF